MRKVLMIIFICSVTLFILLGSVLVLGQLLGLLVANGNWVINLDENLASTVYFVTSIAAFSGYLLSYTKKKKTEG
ncbi:MULTISPECIES: hypothetical protein [Shouchella]|uniref:Uncharacterized protein n=2 Tax=Shouchella TaxID=2893057 RepID=A0ABY7WAD7_9BACI|nr:MULTISPECIES: hypothetical protein [Shouchella]MED4128657.1 hypothetical protein [Shouchella miscanthi]WDF04810.1 hypothetical protein PQ477_04940 [Shouchella hunanensis]GAF24317.1 hypothetical protein JCM19047_4200 [Bacillus sp. JCM 19047]